MGSTVGRGGMTHPAPPRPPNSSCGRLHGPVSKPSQAKMPRTPILISRDPDWLSGGSSHPAPPTWPPGLGFPSGAAISR